MDIVLADVAERADMSVQTILRHFGSREALFDAAVEFGNEEVTAERATPVGNIPEAVRILIDHYEARGDWVIAILGQELSEERIRKITTSGRLVHRDWVQTVFAPQLAAWDKEDERSVAIDLLVVATDVYTWKLLRRDRALDRASVEVRIRRLVDAVVASGKGN